MQAEIKAAGLRALLALLATGFTAATFSPAAEAADDSPCGPQEAISWSAEPVQLCPLTSPLSANGWVPVYAQPVANPAGAPAPPPTGWLHGIGDQRFVCQARFPAATYYHPERGWFNDWWAYTLSDDRVWGWVPEVFFTGGGDDEQDAGLRLCPPPAQSAPPPSPPSSPGAGATPPAAGAGGGGGGGAGDPHKHRRRQRATLLLRPQRHSFRNGQSLQLSGRLQTHPRPRGVLVVLEAEVGDSWEPFGTTPTVRGGRFSFRYRFRSTTGAQRYHLRARIPKQRGYPFRSGASNVVSVRVSG